MKYTYKTVTDNQSVELPREWERLLTQFDDAEKANDRGQHRSDRKYVRQIVSFEALGFEGDCFADDTDVAGDVERIILSDAAREIIATLPTQEQRVMELLYDEGLAVGEVARLLGVRHPTIIDARKRALKKIAKEI